jgi:hypothetical protein
MRVKSLKLAAFLVALCVPASFASAQWDASIEAETSTSATVAPTPPPAPPEMVETPPPAQPAVPPEEEGLKVGFTWALQIGVPIFLDVNRDIARPGADISFFGGADFGFFVIGGAAGIGWNPIDLNGQVVEGVLLSGRSPLTRLFLSIPEVRFQVPDLKVVLPYISGAFDMNFWNFRETSTGCNYYYCSNFSVYRFTPGFTGRGGIAFEAKHGIYIDMGLRYSFTGEGNFFMRSHWWLTPYVGVLVRRR